jgi:hypothetical protein
MCAGNAEQLQQLLDDPECDVDLQDEEGRTALHFAGGSLIADDMPKFLQAVQSA